MKTLILGLFTFASLALHAEEPTLPDNIKFADVCRYHTWSSELTCRDAGGNALIHDVRVFKTFQWTAYDPLPMVSAMKRLGFDGVKHRQVGEDVVIIFARPVTCR